MNTRMEVKPADFTVKSGGVIWFEGSATGAVAKIVSVARSARDEGGASQAEPSRRGIRTVQGAMDCDACYCCCFLPSAEKPNGMRLSVLTGPGEDFAVMTTGDPCVYSNREQP